MDNRLPLAIERILLDAVINPLDRKYRYDVLEFADAGMRDGFMDALVGNASVHAGVCGDEPNEICVRATGIDRNGVRWGDVAIVLLEPEWSAGAEQSQDLAEDIVTLWPRLVAAAAASGDRVVDAVMAAGGAEAR